MELFRSLFFSSFTNPRRKLKGLSRLKQRCQRLCYPLTASACEVSWGDPKGGLPHFNNRRLCQWQLLWLFWNSGWGVSGAHIDSKCDSSCHCGIPVLMIGQLIEWSVSSRVLWAVYRVAGPLLIRATFAATRNKQVMGITQLSFSTPRGILIMFVCARSQTSTHVRTIVSLIWSYYFNHICSPYSLWFSSSQFLLAILPCWRPACPVVHVVPVNTLLFLFNFFLLR